MAGRSAAPTSDPGRAPHAPTMTNPPAIRVCTAAEARALDDAAIAAGTPGAALMQRAGAAAASEIARRFPDALSRGVLVLAGAGNNGGDGWVTARALAAAGVDLSVWESGPARGHDAAAERALALAQGVRVVDSPCYAGEGIVVDALLGTGASGPVRGSLVDGVHCARNAAQRGAIVVALDVPTGIDATTGEIADAAVHVRAQLTLTFGTLKRGHLVAREECGTIAVLDIGLPPARLPSPGPGDGTRDDGIPVLVGAAAARAFLPHIAADAHKGTKGRVAIVGGAPGMAGAVILAAQGALRAGAGLVKVVAHPGSLDAVRTAVPQALTAAWDHDHVVLAHDLAGWAGAIAIGPGLGTSQAARETVMHILGAGAAPVVLDADALNIFAGEPAALRAAVGSRRVLLTPHPLEMMRLAGATDAAQVLAERFEIGARFACEVGATVLLKGVPTVVSSPDGRRLVSATGTPALATGGSGDVLTGMAATFLAQVDDPLHAGALAAWAHGRAAEIASVRAGTSRGVPLDEILADVAHAAWGQPAPAPPYPVLCELP